MGVRLNEHKYDLRGENGEYSTADFLPLPTGKYLVWIEPNGMTVTIKQNENDKSKDCMKGYENGRKMYRKGKGKFFNQIIRKK